MAAERFRLGVNYWPSEVAMAWLPAYDAGVVRRDFERIAAAGMDTVRVFARWADVQPTPAVLDRAAIAALVDSADAAAETGVELIMTLFTGHMSGVNWVPAWATGGRDGDPRFRVVSDTTARPGPPSLRNWYGDDEIVEAHVAMAAGLASALAGHPGVWAWDLGNENSNCTVPPSPAAAERWLDRVTSAIRSRDPGRAVTIGLHMEDLEEDRVIGPAEAAAWCDVVCMHGYPAYASWASGPLDHHLVPFLTELTRWLAGGTPVLFEEFGQSTTPVGQPASGLQVTEHDAASYTAKTLDDLLKAGAVGALLWCHADYAAALHGQAPFDLATHERTFGLWRADHTPKPVVEEISRRRGSACVVPPDTTGWLDVTAEELLADRKSQLPRLYRRYRAARPSPG